jgi:hypothetical protein
VKLPLPRIIDDACRKATEMIALCELARWEGDESPSHGPHHQPDDPGPTWAREYDPDLDPYHWEL